MLFRKQPVNQLVITIPDPCKEHWGKMDVVNTDQRYCSSCERTLTDFSKMSDDELMLYFANSPQKLCGRFSSRQLNRAITTLPGRTQKATWWKAALLLPAALFGKSLSAQVYETSASRDTAHLLQQKSTGTPLCRDEHADADVQHSSPALSDELQVKDQDDEVLFLGGVSYSGPYVTVNGFHQNHMITGTPNYAYRSLNLIGWQESMLSGKYYPEYIQPAEVVISLPDPAAVTIDELPEPKEEPATPPLPKAPWYEAILPGVLRIKRKG